PDAQHPLAHIGITDHDLTRMGLSNTDKSKLMERAVALNKQGLGSVSEVESTNEAIKDVVNWVFNSELSQGTIGSVEQERGGAMRQHLLNDFLTDAMVIKTGDAPPSGGARMALDPSDPNKTKMLPLDGNHPTVKAHFKDQANKAKDMVDDTSNTAWDE